MRPLPFLTPKPERRLLDESKRAKSMLWVMAIMLFLTTLAAGAGLGLASAAGALDRQLGGRLTIQVVEPDASLRDREAGAIANAVRQLSDVKQVTVVDRERLAKLLQPWLGDAGVDPSLPMPAMIDVDLMSGGDGGIARVTATARTITPNAQVDPHAKWLSPIHGFILSLGWLALGLVLLMASATGAVVLLAARTGLDTHRATIDVLHMLGATDQQVARLFQRRIAIDTLIGGVAGTIAAAVLILLLQAQMGSLGAELLDSAVLGQQDWLVIAALPILFTLMAMLAARMAVLRALRGVL